MKTRLAAVRDFLAQNPSVKRSERSGNTLAQVLLTWGLRRGYVVLPKSSTPSRIDSNLQVPTLSDADFEAVNKAAEGRHTRFVNMKDTLDTMCVPDKK